MRIYAVRSYSPEVRRTRDGCFSIRVQTPTPAKAILKFVKIHNRTIVKF